MQKLIIVFLLIIGLRTYGQKLIEETYQNKGNTKFVSEKKAYYHNQTFLNNDNTYTKKRFFARTGIQIYENNYISINPEVRHGIQISFDRNDTLYFNKEVPTGIWRVNDFFKGKRLVLNYQFDLEYDENENWDQLNVHLNDLEKKPGFPDGFQGFNDYIYKNRYFDIFNVDRIKLEIENPAIVKLCFNIDTAGHVNNIKVIKGVHPIYDKEAVRLIRESTDWTPGERNGQKISTKIYYLIHFQRNKEYE